MKTKWTATIMASVLLVSALAGCSSNGNNKNTNGNEGAGTPTNTGSSNGETSNQPYKEKLSISFISRDIYTANGAVSKDDKVVDFLNDKFNMDLTLNYVPSPNQNEVYTKLNSMIASNDIPDIMEARIDDLGGQVYRNLAKSGQLIDVEKFIKEREDRYPNLFERISDPDADSYRAEDGKLYALPRLFGMWDHAWYIRKDWLDELGLDMPTTLAELHEVLKVFVEKDPEGKKNVGLTLSNAWWLNHVYAGFTGGFNWTQQDGKYVYNYNRPEIKEAINYVHGLYAENLLDKEFFTRISPSATKSRSLRADERASSSSGRASLARSASN
jgi:putative aldouronate transport system substrate-binding protein